MKIFMILACMGTLVVAEPPVTSYEIPPGSYSAPSYHPVSSKGYEAPPPPPTHYGHPSPPNKGDYGVPSPPPPTHYGHPSPPIKGDYGVPASPPNSHYGVPEHKGHVYKHIYVHSAPDEGHHFENKVVRVKGGHDKHVNIIFVKAPSSSSQQKTEVILPEQDQQKTLVYVLLKKGDSSSDIKVKGPAPTKPSRPEVFFIRYKDGKHESGYGPPPPSNPHYGPPPTSNPHYGPPKPIHGGY